MPERGSYLCLTKLWTLQTKKAVEAGRKRLFYVVDEARRLI
jgi:hypothetical protein